MNNDLELTGAYGRLGAQLARAAAGAFGALSFVYLIGWMRADAYYSALGAGWALASVPAQSLLGMSLYPVVILGVFLVASLTDRTKFTPEKSVKIGLYIALVLGIGGLVIQLLLEHFGNYAASVDAAKIAAAGWYALTGAMLTVLVWGLRQTGFRWSGKLIYGLALVLFSLYLAPRWLGRAEGKRDQHPTESTLPHVRLADAPNEDWRLLHVAERKVYIVQLRNGKQPPVFRIVEADKIGGIVAAVEPTTTPRRPVQPTRPGPAP